MGLNLERKRKKGEEFCLERLRLRSPSSKRDVEKLKASNWNDPFIKVLKSLFYYKHRKGIYLYKEIVCKCRVKYTDPATISYRRLPWKKGIKDMTKKLKEKKLYDY